MQKAKSLTALMTKKRKYSKGVSTNPKYSMEINNIEPWMRRDKGRIIPEIEGGKETIPLTKREILLVILAIILAVAFVWVGNLYIDLALSV